MDLIEELYTAKEKQAMLHFLSRGDDYDVAASRNYDVKSVSVYLKLQVTLHGFKMGDSFDQIKFPPPYDSHNDGFNPTCTALQELLVLLLLVEVALEGKQSGYIEDCSK